MLDRVISGPSSSSIPYKSDAFTPYSQGCVSHAALTGAPGFHFQVTQSSATSGFQGVPLILCKRMVAVLCVNTAFYTTPPSWCFASPLKESGWFVTILFYFILFTIRTLIPSCTLLTDTQYTMQCCYPAGTAVLTDGICSAPPLGPFFYWHCNCLGLIPSPRRKDISDIEPQAGCQFQNLVARWFLGRAVLKFLFGFLFKSD